MKEPKIGERIILNGIPYTIEKATDECEGCALFEQCRTDNPPLICDQEERQDETSIIAVYERVN